MGKREMVTLMLGALLVLTVGLPATGRADGCGELGSRKQESGHRIAFASLSVALNGTSVARRPLCSTVRPAWCLPARTARGEARNRRDAAAGRHPVHEPVRAIPNRDTGDRVTPRNLPTGTAVPEGARRRGSSETPQV
jgi:hypothetical protein